MSIRYFGDATAFNVEDPDELFEALDTLHTQVLDNFSDAEAAPFVEVLERAMDTVATLRTPRL